MVLREAFSAVVSTVAADASTKSDTRATYIELSATLLAFVASIVIMSFIGKWLWNSIVVDLFTVARPARSVWQIVGLVVFAHLLTGR
jgi:hypothetical protein